MDFLLFFRDQQSGQLAAFDATGIETFGVLVELKSTLRIMAIDDNRAI